MIAPALSMLSALLAAAPVPVEAVPFPGLSEAGRTVGCAVLRQGLTLDSPAGGFGGYSGLSVEGDRALLVSDRGHRLILDLTVDPDGLIQGVRAADLAPLSEADGTPLGGRRADIEDVAFLGRIHAVSAEGENRVARLSGDRLTDVGPAPPEDEAVLGLNSGYEAIALMPDGQVMVVSEGTDASGAALVRRGSLGQPLAAWAASRYRPARGFRVTSARVDPHTGDLFVLERAYSLWRGPRMRIARVPADRLGEAVLTGREVTRMGWREGIDNMEGLDLARTHDGALRLYLVSDDNLSAAQRTVLLTLSLAEGCEE